MKREVISETAHLGKRAIVVGAGLGGLSAARALSDYFDEVVILDRDELPDSVIPRPGVPQGKQPHFLLKGGLKALENLFPGFANQRTHTGFTGSPQLPARLGSIGRPGCGSLSIAIRDQARSQTTYPIR